MARYYGFTNLQIRRAIPDVIKSVSKTLGKDAESDRIGFLEYFKKRNIQLEKYSGRFEGKALGHPSTNNGLESSNRVIKDKATLRERLSLGLFFDRTFNKLRYPIHPDSKAFVLSPKISIKLFTEVYQWS